jgi:hypothetical protein
MIIQYSTKDFYCAAYLIAAGAEVDSYKMEGDQMVFLFQDTPRLQGLATSYYGLTANINPVAYGNALKNLKSAIYAYKDKERTNDHVPQQRKTK